jgi:hypothetical protein
MVCQLRPLVYSLGLNNPPRICLTPRKLRVKNLWRNKQGNCRCKMAGARIRSFTKFCGQMPQIATTGITSWQTALKWTADCQVPRSGCCGQVYLSIFIYSRSLQETFYTILQLGNNRQITWKANLQKRLWRKKRKNKEQKDRYW